MWDEVGAYSVRRCRGRCVRFLFKYCYWKPGCLLILGRGGMERRSSTNVFGVKTCCVDLLQRKQSLA